MGTFRSFWKCVAAGMAAALICVSSAGAAEFRIGSYGKWFAPHWPMLSAKERGNLPSGVSFVYLTKTSELVAAVRSGDVQAVDVIGPVFGLQEGLPEEEQGIITAVFSGARAQFVLVGVPELANAAEQPDVLRGKTFVIYKCSGTRGRFTAGLVTEFAEKNGIPVNCPSGDHSSDPAQSINFVEVLAGSGGRYNAFKGNVHADGAVVASPVHIHVQKQTLPQHDDTHPVVILSNTDLAAVPSAGLVMTREGLETNGSFVQQLCDAVLSEMAHLRADREYAVNFIMEAGKFASRAEYAGDETAARAAAEAAYEVAKATWPERKTCRMDAAPLNKLADLYTGGAIAVAPVDFSALGE